MRPHSLETYTCAEDSLLAGEGKGCVLASRARVVRGDGQRHRDGESNRRPFLRLVSGGVLVASRVCTARMTERCADCNAIRESSPQAPRSLSDGVLDRRATRHAANRDAVPRMSG